MKTDNKMATVVRKGPKGKEKSGTSLRGIQRFIKSIDFFDEG